MKKAKRGKIVLVLPDLHLPFEKKGILEHCLNVSEEYKCNEFINIGDEVDLCSVSSYEKDPDGANIGSEYQQALEKLKIWYSCFPNMKVCIGNHSSRIFRLARASGLSKKFIKTYEEIWEAPKGWKWAERWEIDKVLYTHGSGLSGRHAALRVAMQYRQNTCIGHIHSEAGINYSASSKDLIWGMNVGGAIDDNSYAAAYAKDNIKKSIIGVGVVVEGTLPLFIPMKL